MNINMSVECETCGERTNCRIGMSNRKEQPLRFCCQACGSPTGEMQRLNHLIKGLFYLQYLIIDRGALEKTAAKAKGRRK